MASEITLQLNFRCINSDYDSGSISVSKQINQTAQGAHSGIIDVTATATTLSVGGVTTTGYMFLRNLDTANTVVYGSTAAGGFEYRLKPGEFALARRNPGIGQDIKTSSGTAKVQILLLQD